MDVVAEVVEDILEHHGVKGMHWGTRKEETSSGQSKQSKKVSKLLEKSTRGNQRSYLNLKIELHNSVHEQTNARIATINAKPKYKKALAAGTMLDDTHPTTQAYLHEVRTAYVGELNKSLAKLAPSGTTGKQYKVVKSSELFGFTVGFTDVQHQDPFEMNVRYVRDNKGKIIDLVLDEDTMTQADNFVDDMLEHYGVKGMRWGQRTAAGPQAVVVTDKKRRLRAKGGGGHPAHPDAVRARTLGQVAKRSGHKALSDQELQEYSKRLNLEQNVKRLEMSNKNSAQQFVSGLLGSSGGKGGGGAGGGSIESAAGSIAAKQVANVLAKKK